MRKLFSLALLVALALAATMSVTARDCVVYSPTAVVLSVNHYTPAQVANDLQTVEYTWCIYSPVNVTADRFAVPVMTVDVGRLCSYKFLYTNSTRWTQSVNTLYRKNLTRPARYNLT